VQANAKQIDADPSADQAVGHDQSDSNESADANNKTDDHGHEHDEHDEVADEAHDEAHDEGCNHTESCDHQHDCGTPCNHNGDPSSEVPPVKHQTQHIAHPRRAMPQLDSRAYNSKPSAAPKPAVGKKQTLGHKPVTQKFKYR
jgi:hypothetical protein